MVEIPEEWNVVRTSEIFKIDMGQSPSSKTYNQNRAGLPFYQGVTDFGPLHPTPTTWCTKPRKIAKKNTILFSVRAPVGEINITSLECAVGRGIAAIQCNENDLMYSYYLLTQNKKQYKYLSQGTIFESINREHIIKAPIPYTHDKQEQIKIALILSNVDAIIETTQNIIDKTEKLKKGLMQQLLTKGIGHTKFKKVRWLFGKEIEIPEDWSVKQIKDVFEFLKTGTNSRSDLKESGVVRYIHYGDIHQKWHYVLDCATTEIPFIDNEKVKKISPLQNGDLVIADVSEDYEGSGASVLIKNVDGKKIVSGLHTYALRDNNYVTTSEFRTYITSITFIKNQIIAYVTGTSVFGLSKSNLSKIKIVIPPISEQQKIALILLKVDTHIQKNQDYKQKLKWLKKGLMQKLLTGQIRVKG